MTRSKRLFDVVVSSLGLVTLMPIGLVVALAIKLDSPGPVLFRGMRAGKNGKPFFIFKFRTMVSDTGVNGAGITTRDDPRITRVGGFLRRTKLDELPQLLNVLRGEMSLVGPRPEDPRYVKFYSMHQRAILAVPPGITSIASLVFSDEQEMLHGSDWEETYVYQVMPKKLELELAYLRRRSFWSDLDLVARTILALGKREAQIYGSGSHD
jgi:lipopolysaccharide/colanic/teichoic acid biosynthesis glycosyltransferase